jgi:virulence-associated protein VagC
MHFTHTRLTPKPFDFKDFLMINPAKVFASDPSQAIRLPKQVQFSSVSNGILISEGNTWDSFKQGCRGLGEGFFKAMKGRERRTPQVRDFNAGMP